MILAEGYTLVDILVSMEAIIGNGGCTHSSVFWNEIWYWTARFEETSGWFSS